MEATDQENEVLVVYANRTRRTTTMESLIKFFLERGEEAAWVSRFASILSTTGKSHTTFAEYTLINFKS
jgi:hypothetical protein